MLDFEEAMPDPAERDHVTKVLRDLGFSAVDLLNIDDRSEYTFSVASFELERVGRARAEAALRLALPHRLVSVTTYTDDKVLPVIR
jgi:hypothetical protein